MLAMVITALMILEHSAFADGSLDSCTPIISSTQSDPSVTTPVYPIVATRLSRISGRVLCALQAEMMQDRVWQEQVWMSWCRARTIARPAKVGMVLSSFAELCFSCCPSVVLGFLSTICANFWTKAATESARSEGFYRVSL